MSIVVIGSSNTDMIVKVPRIPKPGETILGGKFITAAGGKGANQAVAAARAGGSVTFVACVGNDMFAEQALEAFKQDKINTRFIKRIAAEPSGVALIFVDDNGENSIAVASGANNSLFAEDIINIESTIRAADIVLMQLETPVETIISAANIAKDAGAKVILNPAPAQSLGNDLLKALSIITPNETEAELLTGVSVSDLTDAEKAADVLLNKGLETVVITMGSKGAFYKSQNQIKVIPGFKVDAVDTTAAGDVFNGALSVAIAEGKSLQESVLFANAAAALSVTKIGAQPSVPTRKEIEQMLLNSV